MTKPEGINLDILPHHVKRGAANTQKSRQRERRMNEALLGKEVIIRHEHRANGGQARKRAVEREKVEGGSRIQSDARSSPSEPFKGSSEALCDLASAFGYPTRELAPAPTRVFRNAEMVEPIKPDPELKPTNQGRRRKAEEVRRETAAGPERCCSSCSRWLPETTTYYRWRAARNHWESECSFCHSLRRKEFYERNGF